MNYYGGKELGAAFRKVRANTITIAQDIPEEHYGFRPVEGTRTVAELLSHIAHGVRFHETITLSGRTNLDGFDFPAFMQQLAADTNQPRTKAELIALLESSGDRFAAQLEAATDEFLGGVITFPPGGDPPSRTRFDILMSAKEHEMHHRGQLMLIERLLGITPHLTRQNEARRAAMLARRAAG